LPPRDQPEHKSHSNHHHHHHHKQQHKHKQQEAHSDEEGKLIEQLQVIHSKIELEITPQVKKYEKDVKEFMSKSEKTEKDKKKHIYMGAYLNEQLMHILFDLDAFSCGPNNLNARQLRKENVKIAQALLDKVDEIKSVVKNVTIIE
jgi:hypothetical protein